MIPQEISRTSEPVLCPEKGCLRTAMRTYITFDTGLRVQESSCPLRHHILHHFLPSQIFPMPGLPPAWMFQDE